MTLDDYKESWNRQVNLDRISSNDLVDMLKSRAFDNVSKLRRSVRLELYSTALLAAACAVAAAFATSIELQRAAGALTVVCLVYCFYYFKKLALLNNFPCESRDLKTDTLVLLTNFKTYLRFYRTGYRVLIPVSMLIGLVIGGKLLEGDRYIETFKNPAACVLIAFVLILTGYLFDLALKWYLHKLYGVYLQRLENVLADLDEK